jgi:hypothetical protein
MLRPSSNASRAFSRGSNIATALPAHVPSVGLLGNSLSRRDPQGGRRKLLEANYPGPRRRTESIAVEESWEEGARTRRLDSRRGRLAAHWLASGPADSANDKCPSRLISRAEQPAKGAFCEVFGPNLQASCLQSRRRRGDNPHRYCGRAVRRVPTWKDGHDRKPIFVATRDALRIQSLRALVPRTGGEFRGDSALAGRQASPDRALRWTGGPIAATSTERIESCRRPHPGTRVDEHRGGACRRLKPSGSDVCHVQFDEGRCPTQRVIADG